jgi:hypothetical protein
MLVSADPEDVEKISFVFTHSSFFGLLPLLVLPGCLARRALLVDRPQQRTQIVQPLVDPPQVVARPVLA